jgi:hypothetical protein
MLIYDASLMDLQTLVMFSQETQAKTTTEAPATPMVMVSGRHASTPSISTFAAVRLAIAAQLLCLNGMGVEIL